MKITMIHNEFGETNMIISLSDADMENLNDGSGMAYSFGEEIDCPKKVADVTIVKE